tara:strand:+ start:494 stop:904 length:411 start_codon:yes stop_codon:yes gene_type:complete
MIFETEEDLRRETKAISKFVNIFKGNFKKLGRFDIDYKIFNSENKLIAYAEVKGRKATIKEAFPLCVAARKLVKLADKRLNPTMIWACSDGIIYSTVEKISGEVRWGGRTQRQGSTNDLELMVYYENQKAFKYIKY